MGTIYTNVPGSWYVPGIYVNVELGRGTPSAALQTRKVLLVGNKLEWAEEDPPMWSEQFFPPIGLDRSVDPPVEDYSLRDETAVDSVYAVPSLLVAAARFGYGSELYIMAEAAFEANPNVALYAYVQAEPVSGSRAKTDDITVSIPGGITAGTLTLSIGNLGKQIKCNVRVKADDNLTKVTNKIIDGFNEQLREIAYYCHKVDDETFKFKAKQIGALWNNPDGSGAAEGLWVSYNDGDTGVVLNDGTSTTQFKIGQVVGTGDLTLGTGVFANDAVKAERYHYIVISPNDSTNVGKLDEFLSSQADPIVGLRQQGQFGINGYVSISDAIDKFDERSINPRSQCIWSANTEYMPGQLAAAVASVRQLWESSDVAVNLCLKEVPGVPMIDDTKLLTTTQKNLVLGAGITPLVPHQGRMVILRSVTCAANNDITQVIDTGKVTVSDFIADDIEIKMASRYKGFKLSPDTDIPLPSRVTTPSNIKKSLLEWLRVNEKAGRITRVTELADGIKVEIDTEVPGRVNFEIPEDVVDIFAVGAGNIIQIG